MQTQKKLSCTQREYHITPKDLPLCCPMPDTTLWNAHPQVYLEIDTEGHAKCPYCGAVYILNDAD